MSAPTYTPSYMQPQSSGASGPAYAQATPRTDPIPAASTQGPSQMQLRERWQAYCGDFVGPLKPLAGQPDLNVITNRCAPMVRQGVDFLFGKPLKLTHNDSHAQAILDAVWGNEDKRMTLLSKARINGGVYGHNFVKIVTPKNKKPLSIDNPPRLVVQNPELYSVRTDPDDCELVTCYYCTWQDSAGVTQTWHQQRTERVDPDDPNLAENNNSNDPVESEADPDAHWEISNWVHYGSAPTSADDWQQVGKTAIWPYPFAPIMDKQNYPNPNEHWGAADIDASYVNLNKQLHLIESNTNSVMYSHGHPWLFATGADTSAITPTPGVITDLGSAEARIQAITATGDLAHMMDFSAQVRANMDENSASPGVATGRVAELPKGAISGILVRLLYQSRLARMEHERRLYGGLIREISRAVLILCGQESAAEEDIELTWQDPLPQDDLAMAQMALTLQQLGVSDHSVYAMIGLNYDTEQEYKKQEAQDALTAFAHGQGMPPAATPAMPGAPAPQQQQPGQPPAPEPSGNNGQMPPTNHPAAVAQRAAVKAVSKLAKAGAK